MNKQRGNMYPFVTHTWNPVRGCKHECRYCYVRSLRGYDMGPRVSERALAENLGYGKFIFVCSTADLFGTWVPKDWIERTLDRCRQFDNLYLFQSKNPMRMWCFDFPVRRYFGTTIETNRTTAAWSCAPPPEVRAAALAKLPGDKMVSIEPIMDFDLEVMLEWMRSIKPKFVSIGADSKRSGLPEPTWDKVDALIRELKSITDVRLKANLARLAPKHVT